MVMIDFKLVDIKLESSDTYLLINKENSIIGFQRYFHLSQECGFKYIPISQRL